MKCLFPFGLIYFLLCFPAFSQAAIDTMAIRTLLEEAAFAIDAAEFKLADSLAQAALQQASPIKKWEAQSRRTLAYSAERQGLWKKAHATYLQSLEDWASIPDSFEMGITYWYLTIMKDDEGDYLNQLKFAEQGFSIFEDLKDVLRKGKISINIANAQLNLGDHKRAKRAYFKALHLLRSSPEVDDYDLGIVQYGIGHLYFQAEQLDSASFFIRSALDIFKSSDDLGKQAQAHNILGAIFEEKEAWQKAHAHFTTSAELAKSVEDQDLQFNAFLNLSRIEISNGQLRKAWSNLIKAELALGDTGDRLDRESLAAVEADLSALQQKKTKRIILISSAMIVGLLGASISFLIQKQKQKLLNQDLALVQTKLRHENELLTVLNDIDEAAAQAKVDGEEQERHRLRDLVHDDIASQLAAARWRLEQFISTLDEEKDYREELNIIRGMVHQACGDARNVERLLDQKPGDWIEEYVKYFELLASKFGQNQPKVRFLMHGIEQNLCDEQGYAIKRILRIATTNTLLHAQANELTCQLNQVEDELIILIEDDGRGFDTSAPTAGNGLKNLKQLVEQLQGEIQIDSKPGKGTTITSTIPLTR